MSNEERWRFWSFDDPLSLGRGTRLSAAKSNLMVSRAVGSGGFLQRKCACDAAHAGENDCAECRKKRVLQRNGATPSSPRSAPPIVHEVLRSPGQPLDTSTRAFMEPRFGHDFSRVRVHTDGSAAESARAVNALAYTVGSDVVFGAGQYTPQTRDGQSLIAHELTHVLQQAQGTSATLQRREVSSEPSCPAGFNDIQRATWFNCGEAGARNLACAVCTAEGHRDCNCNHVLQALGHSNIIAPPSIGHCGDIFEITAPGRTASPIEVTLAERPGGTPLDIHQSVIAQLGFTAEQGRYTVCLRHTDRRDQQVMACGPAACAAPAPTA